MARRRGDQPIDQPRGLNFIAPAERLDDALHVAAALARVLDEVEVFVGSNLLDADKYGAAPLFSGTSTTILWAAASKFLNIYCNRLADLAPHLGVPGRIPSVSAASSERFTPN